MAFYFGAFLIFPQISLHLVFCLIAGVLGLHLTFIFLGREAKSREIYKVKCQSQFKGARKFSSNQFIRSTPLFSTQISGPFAIPSNNLDPCKFCKCASSCSSLLQHLLSMKCREISMWSHPPVSCVQSQRDHLKSVPSRTF